MFGELRTICFKKQNYVFFLIFEREVLNKFLIRNRIGGYEADKVTIVGALKPDVVVGPTLHDKIVTLFMYGVFPQYVAGFP